MGSRNTSLVTLFTFFIGLFAAQAGWSQTRQYQRPQAAPATPAKPGEKMTEKESDKLDISELQDRYWAPKDTDFAVVQNRTYAKEKRFSFSLLTGPVMNDVFNSGFSTGFIGNYYFSERYGVQLSHISSNLSDSKAVDNFRTQLGGGAVLPDWNTDESYTSVGFNWVPIYAKMSFLNRNILYFDLQITPHVGTANYRQNAQVSTGKNGTKQSSFTYGLDITQYYFLRNNFALRFDYHNRWYKHDILKWQDGLKIRDETTNTTMFLFGVTYFH